MNRPTLPQIARTVAGIVILVTLPVGFGVPGVLAATLTIAVLATLPPMYAFAVGQHALAALASTPLPELLAPPVVGAELGLLLALWSDLATPDNRNLVPAVVVPILLLAGVAVATVGETESLWAAGGVLLASIVLLAYAIHRYTIVFVLEEAPP